MLQFTGRGSAFTEAHNCAFFRYQDLLVLLDCPMSALPLLRQTVPSGGYGRIAVLVTHTHGDHAGGIPMLIHLAKYVLKIPVTVVAPSEEVESDLRFLITRLDGCADDAFTLVTLNRAELPFPAEAIPVRHAPTLSGRCFGYHLRIQNTDVVYTGDTAELAPFLPFLHEGAYLYTEAAAFRSDVHLWLPEILDTLLELSRSGVKVYLMHLDDEARIAEMIAGTEIRPAPLGSPAPVQGTGIIRRFERADLDGCANVYCAAFSGAPWNEAWTLPQAKRRLEELVASPLTLGWVYEKNGIAGMLLGTREMWLYGVNFFLRELCVLPQMQGCGIGTALLDSAREDLNNAGFTGIFLHTNKGFPSERFYLQNGFVPNEEEITLFSGLPDKSTDSETGEN